MLVLLVLSAGGTYLYLSGSSLAAPLKPVVASMTRLVKSRLPQKTADKAKGSTATASAGQTAGGTAGPGGDASTAAVWAEIQRKTDELTAREKAMTEREAQLILGEQRLAQEQDAFLKVKVSMDKLALMYEAMKPNEAAAIIGQLPERQAANLLARMDESQAGKILALFEKSLAARLTLMLAGN